MLTFRTLFSLPAILSTTLIAHALAAPRPDGVIGQDKDDEPEVQFAAALTGGERCDDDELQHIRDGFAEMTQLFLSAQRPDFRSGQAELEFFGRQDRIANYTEMIEGNLRRAAQYANVKGDEVRNPDIHVRCDDPMRICKFGNKREGEHVAYNIGNEPHINFCDNYFKLDPLDKRVDKESMDEIDAPKLMEYYNRATAWARQVMHFSEVGTAVRQTAVPAQPNSTAEWEIIASDAPMNISVLAGVLNERPETDGPNDIQALKYAYGVTRSKLLAVLSTQEPYDAANNAENYALYAQARYVMEKKGFYPSLPVMDFGNDMAVLTNEQIQEGERKRFAFYDVPDVVALPPGMDPEGAPLQVISSASGLFTTSFGWTGQAGLALSWAIASCFMLSAIG